MFPYPWDIANLNSADIRMAEIVLNLWTSFATNGKPQSIINDRYDVCMFSWPPLTDIIGPYLHIDAELRIDDNYSKEFIDDTRQLVSASDTNSSAISDMCSNISSLLLLVILVLI